MLDTLDHMTGLFVLLIILASLWCGRIALRSTDDTCPDREHPRQPRSHTRGALFVRLRLLAHVLCNGCRVVAAEHLKCRKCQVRFHLPRWLLFSESLISCTRTQNSVGKRALLEPESPDSLFHSSTLLGASPPPFQFSRAYSVQSCASKCALASTVGWTSRGFVSSVMCQQQRSQNHPNHSGVAARTRRRSRFHCMTSDAWIRFGHLTLTFERFGHTSTNVLPRHHERPFVRKSERTLKDLSFASRCEHGTTPAPSGNRSSRASLVPASPF